MGGYHYWPDPLRGGEAHDLSPDHRSEQRGSGADVTGPAGATTPPEPPAGPHPFVGRQDRWCEQCHRPDRDPIHATASPPDLTDAIQAATDALRRQALDVLATGVPIDTAGVARIAVEAAWKVWTGEA